MRVEGYVAAGFEPVRDAFAQNFELGLEQGAASSVVLDGRVVVDLWAGTTGAATAATWQRHTIVNLMSVSKGVAALLVHALCDQGRIDLDARVADYWPAFASGGKADVLVRHVLDHTAGLEVLTDPLRPGAVYDWAEMIRAIEEQELLHEPGSTPAYHTVTMSFLVGELVRRVTGTSYSRALLDHVTGPAGADFHVGLAATDLARCARFVRWAGYNARGHGDDGPSDLLVQAWAQFDPAHDDDFNSTQFRTAEIPGVNGHGNARAVAAIYAAALDGRLLSASALDAATQLQWFSTEPVLSHHYRMGLGLTLNSPDAYMGPHEEAFGHVGAGGSTGFADPVAGVAFAYGMNLMHPSRDNGPRARRIIDALYGCLGT